MKAAAKRGNLGAAKEDKPMTIDDNDNVFEEFVSSVAVMELTTPKKKKGMHNFVYIMVVKLWMHVNFTLTLNFAFITSIQVRVQSLVY